MQVAVGFQLIAVGKMKVPVRIRETGLRLIKVLRECSHKVSWTMSLSENLLL